MKLFVQYKYICTFLDWTHHNNCSQQSLQKWCSCHRKFKPCYIMPSFLAVTNVFYGQEVKGQSDKSLNRCSLCCSLQVGDIVSVIDMPPKEDTTWWRGKHGFQVHSSQNTLQAGAINLVYFSLCFPLAVNFWLDLYLMDFKDKKRMFLCKADFKYSEFV